LLVAAAGGVDPGPHRPGLVLGEADEAEAGPDLARGARLVHPEQVRADLDGGLAAARGQAEAELVQRVLHQRRAGHQQHAGLGQVADAADHALGHRVDHEDGVAGFAAPGAAELVDHAGVSPASGSASPRPAKLRRVRSAACQARSTRRPRSAVTMRACPAAIFLAIASSECSPTRWPRWFTNSAVPVTGLNQDMRRRTTSPCWLMVNSIQVPNGSTRSWS